MGYTKAELDDIQRRWNLRFPPDLVAQMRQRRPLRPRGFDWLLASDAEIERSLVWPYESFLFDVRESGLWWPEWGPRPESPSQQAVRLAEAFAAAPRLIPLDGHRYLPETPHEHGNPVFSVYQSDVIYYGTDITDWVRREDLG